MERAAIRHVADREFCFATEKDRFVVRLYAKAGDLADAVLCFQDKYIRVERKDTRTKLPMKKAACDGVLDYFEAELSIHMLCMRYYFALTGKDGEILYYGNYHFFTERPSDIHAMFDCPQEVREEEIFHVPDWAAGKVVYQIFVDRFASDRNVPDELWYKENLHYEDILHGTLKGIEEKLPYLEALGAQVLYLTPVFKAGTSHKYDTIDYLEIDPGFGTKEDLCSLVEKAHQAGMYVILDGVFNHTSTRFFAFQDLLANQEASRYRDWYYPEQFPVSSMGKPVYKAFGYYGEMPKLNCANPEVREYIFKVVSYWMETCKIDGWRLDVADEIGHDFWRAFRKKVREINPDALIVGEIWHYAPEALRGDEWDSVMNYHFYQAALSFFAKGTIGAKEFADELGFMRGRLHPKIYPVLWNLIGSHDTPRFLHEAGGRKEALFLAAAVQMLTPGMPMIYYGDEVGMTGGRDPECRRGMLWKEEKQDRELLAWYRRLIALRRQYPALAVGNLNWLCAEDEQGLLIWTRELEGEKMVTVLLCNAQLSGTQVSDGQTAAGQSPMVQEPAISECIISLPEYAGRWDAMREEYFDGNLKACDVRVLVQLTD